MDEKIRIVVVEDHAVVRDGLVSLLRGEPDLDVVAAHGSGEAAVQAVDRDRPQLALVDLRLPGLDGVATLIALKARLPDLRVVMLTSQEGDEAIYNAIKAGAAGYVFKKQPSEDLLQTIRDVATGRPALSREVSSALSQRLAWEGVTARERTILKHIAQGLSNKEIADTLGISANTVRNQIVGIMNKLDAGDRTQAVTIALQRGIIDLP